MAVMIGNNNYNRSISIAEKTLWRRYQTISSNHKKPHNKGLLEVNRSYHTYHAHFFHMLNPQAMPMAQFEPIVITMLTVYLFEPILGLLINTNPIMEGNHSRDDSFFLRHSKGAHLQVHYGEQACRLFFLNFHETLFHLPTIKSWIQQRQIHSTCRSLHRQNRAKPKEP